MALPSEHMSLPIQHMQKLSVINQVLHFSDKYLCGIIRVYLRINRFKAPKPLKQGCLHGGISRVRLGRDSMVQLTPALTDFKGPTIFLCYRRISVIVNRDLRIVSGIGGFPLQVGPL